ncbi:hypothetical protein CEXT_72451 [Caerostris extrusa]|uniref:Uncharacterized protein n=1 Tax=Caerostris extrusa TaxID=172846 RepID=A0AAV4M7B8_CAEEX|nr:hypothetical protein CEXT_72451 [Caerostris extrusa]
MSEEHQWHRGNNFLIVPKSWGTCAATQEARKSSLMESRSKLERSSRFPSKIPRGVFESLLILILPGKKSRQRSASHND